MKQGNTSKKNNTSAMVRRGHDDGAADFTSSNLTELRVEAEEILKRLPDLKKKSLVGMIRTTTMVTGMPPPPLARGFGCGDVCACV
eukprot:2483399-Pyramimonas_sp.AAC.1